MSTIYLFNTKTTVRMNEANEYYTPNAEQVAYLLKTPSGRYIVATSYGSVGLTVGEYTTVIADQSGRNLGRYLVAGIANKDGSIDGDSSKLKLPHHVFK